MVICSKEEARSVGKNEAIPYRRPSMIFGLDTIVDCATDVERLMVVVLSASAISQGSCDCVR